MLLIVDIDGTISDNNHRRHIQDSIRYYESSREDGVNEGVVKYIQSVRAEDDDVLLVFITTRPAYYKGSDGTRVNYYKQTKQWLHEHGLHAHELSMRDDRSCDQSLSRQEEKVCRAVKLVLEHLNDRDIVYIDDDTRVVEAMRKRCPTVTFRVPHPDGYLTGECCDRP